MRSVYYIVLLLVTGMSCKSDRQAPVVPETVVLESPKKMTKKPYYTIDYVIGKFDPASHADFVPIPVEMADRVGRYMRKDALEAFKKMHGAAAKDGISLVIKSAARNFDYQKGIWERKWNGDRILSDGTNAAKDISDDIQRSLKILEYSSMPGSSRHHWGTDIDLNSFDNEWFESGEGLKIYNWLLANASTYGYCQVYCEKGAHRSSGYNEEKWHYSYMPESQEILEYAQSQLNISDIKGFKGDHTAEAVGIIEKYILGINRSCTH